MLYDELVLLGSLYLFRSSVINPNIHERIIRLWNASV